MPNVLYKNGLLQKSHRNTYIPLQESSVMPLLEISFNTSRALVCQIGDGKKRLPVKAMQRIAFSIYPHKSLFQARIDPTS